MRERERGVKYGGQSIPGLTERTEHCLVPQWRVPRSPHLAERDSLKEDFFGCTRADLQRGARRTVLGPLCGDKDDCRTDGDSSVDEIGRVSSPEGSRLKGIHPILNAQSYYLSEYIFRQIVDPPPLCVIHSTCILHQFDHGRRESLIERRKIAPLFGHPSIEQILSSEIPRPNGQF